MAKIDEKALTPDEKHVTPPREEETLASPSVGPVAAFDTCVAEVPDAIAEESEGRAEMCESVEETSGARAKISRPAVESSETGTEISGDIAETSKDGAEPSGTIASSTPTGSVPSTPPTRVDRVSVEGREAQKAGAGVASVGGHPAPRAAVVATAAAAMAAANARAPRVVARARATVASKRRTNPRDSHAIITSGSKASGGVASTPSSRRTPASKGSPEVMVSDGVVKTPVPRKTVKVSTSGRVIRMPASGAAANRLLSSKVADNTKTPDEVIKTTPSDTITGAVVKQRSRRSRYDAPTASSAARAHGVSSTGVGKGQSSAQHQARQLGRGREEKLTKQGRSPLGRRSLSAPPAGLREEVACGMDTMISDFVTPSDLVTSIKVS